MNIPDEAVSAAAEAVYGSGFDGSPKKDAWLKDFRTALEAAAPYLMAQAWDEGVLVGLEWDETIEYDFATPNPYRPEDAGVEKYGLVGENDEHIHSSRSFAWIKARQAETPGSVITVKRNGAWNDYKGAPRG